LDSLSSQFRNQCPVQIGIGVQYTPDFATIPRLLAELDDLEKFNHVREMVAFIGLAPREKLSGSSVKGKPRLSKIGHARLRKALYMPALVSIQCNPVMIAFYNRLKEKGKNGKVIVCAIMRKQC